MFPPDIDRLAREVLDLARAKGLRVAAVESCTGGLVLAALTAVAGSSDVVEGGLATYSNAAKTALAGVPADLIAAHGAVSEPVALAMAAGGARAVGADAAVSVTGIAGPGGGSPDKPVGLVWFAVHGPAGARSRVERFGDVGREGVRLASVRTALALLRDAVAQAGARG